MVKKSHIWSTPNTFESNSQKRGVYHLKEEDSLKAQLAAMAREVETLKSKLPKKDNHHIKFGSSYEAIHAQDIGEIKSTLSKLTSSLSIQEKGKFSSQVQPNPHAQLEQLGLGELKPTSITLQLADRLFKIPRVLDTEPVVHSNSQTPVILGRPFLATSNAHINCRNGFMQLSFGNMTFELNIFSICKQPQTIKMSTKKYKKYEELSTVSDEKNHEEKKPRKDETYHVVISSKLEFCMKKMGESYKVVPKKSGVIGVENDNGEIVPTRVTTGWRMCIDYRKLNSVTRNDHFPLPFLDQILERIKKKQLLLAIGTFAFRKMPFGLCNTPATFQRCMISIFSDTVEKYLEVFMDDITMFAPDWSMPFEIMCDASDGAIGAVIGQRKDKKPVVISYASRTLNSAQKNYTTTEKELLAVVFALEKFRSYILGSQIVVFTDHSALNWGID
ncbi:hypothetical protein Prudu_017081 [Prunus dulcis]|uniref:Reverse transcriptase RNase H-like domain-containing protein n=1 Tax=Prunus dulcis TaxID=3755 RepID=A0A4Y1RMW1_PRUDU|nr:hypothetical protein Prudu_017081 [Prunus dulcis]